MKIRMLIILLLFPVFIKAQEEHFKGYFFNETPTQDSLAIGFFDTWLGDYSSEIFLTVLNNKIKTINIKELDSNEPLLGLFNLVNITNNYFDNMVIFSNANEKTLRMVNGLLQIYISPSFSEVEGGEITIKVNKKGNWEKIELFISKDEKNNFLLFKKEQKKNKEEPDVYTEVNYLLVEFNLWLKINKYKIKKATNN